MSIDHDVNKIKQQFNQSFLLFLVINFFLIAGILFLINRNFTQDPMPGDADANLKFAYNLAYNGTVSVPQNPITNEGLMISNHREPLPIVAMGIYIRLHPELSTQQTLESITTGTALLHIKHHMLIWGFLCLAGVSATAWVSLKSSKARLIAAVIAIVLTYILFLSEPIVINFFYTEIHAANFIVWSSFTLILALRTWKMFWFASTGVMLGCLVLTKASFLYINLGLIGVLFFIFMLRLHRQSRQKILYSIGLMGITMLLTVLPWMIRNYIYLDSFNIVSDSRREVLWYRAYLNEMTQEEYWGAFGYYSQEPFRTWLNFDQQDVIKASGDLIRLSREQNSDVAVTDPEAASRGKPNETVTYLSTMRAENVRLIQINRQNMDNTNAIRLAADTMQDRAVQSILGNPQRHFKVSILMMWRGAWALPFPYVIPVFISIWVMAFMGIWRQHPVMLSIGLLSVGSLAFYALVSHFRTRYAMATHPNMILATVIGSVWILEK